MKIAFLTKNTLVPAGLVLLAACLFGFKLSILPAMQSLEYSIEGAEPVRRGLPLLIDVPAQRIKVRVLLQRGAWSPTEFYLRANNCIERVLINGRYLESPRLPVCEYFEGKTVDFAPLLIPGANEIIFTISNIRNTAGMDMRVAESDRTLVILNTLMLAALIALCVWMMKRGAVSWMTKGLWYVFIAGLVSRVWYFQATPYGLRSYDYDGHILYVMHILQNWTIPLSGDGWVFHHAPLYYYVSAIFLRAVDLIGFTTLYLTVMLQHVSLIVSVACLWLMLWGAAKLWSGERERAKRIIGASLLAFYPGFVFMASRISNEPLYHALCIVVMLTLWVWWREGDVKYWYIACAVACLAFLTRVSAVFFVPVFAAAFLFKTSGWGNTDRWRLAWKSCVLVVLLTAWYPMLRIAQGDAEEQLSFNNVAMGENLAVRNTPANYVTFNPLKVLAVPYNHSMSDEWRRQYFPEYLYKSMYFGEFRFNERMRIISVLLLLSGFAVMGLAAYGMVRHLREGTREDLVMSLSLVLSLLMIVAYRASFHFSSDQDFRFVMAAFLPLVYFAVKGAWALRGNPGDAARGIVAAHAGLSAVFILLTILLPEA